MLTFLNPAVLIALSAALVPVLIHFLNIRRRKTIQFSSLLLLEEIERSALRKFKINQILLLLLRSLAVFFIVLAFAKPLLPDVIWGSMLGGKQKTTLALVIDNSHSMDTRWQQSSRFAEAKRLALRVLSQSSPSDEVFLTYPSMNTQVEAPLNPDHAQKVISKLSLKPQQRSIQTLLKESLEKLGQARHFNRECYVISDFQQSSFFSKDSLKQNEDSKRIHHLFFIRLNQTQTDNASIIKSNVRTKILEPEKPIRLQTSVDFFSQNPLKKRLLTLRLNDKFKDEAAVSNQTSTQVNAMLSAKPSNPGFITGHIELEADDYLHDNSFWFVSNIPKQIKILVASDNPKEALFLKAALSSYAKPDFFSTKHIRTQDLQSKSLSEYDVLILVGMNKCDAMMGEKLMRFVERGGGLMAFLSPNISSKTNINACLSKLGLGKVQSKTMIQQSGSRTLDRLSANEALFEGIMKSQKLAKKTFKTIEDKVYKAAGYKKTFQETQFLSVLNGKTLATRKQSGKGKIILWATLPTLQHTTFVINPLFSPLIFQSVFWMVSSNQVDKSPIVAGKSTQIQMPGLRTASQQLELIKPNGEAVLPTLISKNDGIYLNAESDMIDEAGAYSVRHKIDLTEIYRFAVNMPVSESDTNTVSDTSLVKLSERFGVEPSNLRIATHSEIKKGLESEIANSRSGYGAWKMFIMVAIALLVVESLVARNMFVKD